MGTVCSVESPCQGDITYYEAGLGACGIVSNGAVENVVALPHVLMGKVTPPQIGHPPRSATSLSSPLPHTLPLKNLII